MKKFISKVTVTGADDSVSPNSLSDLAEAFPFVEFGILLSKNSMGSNRFPSEYWLRNLVETCLGRQLNFSGHICGSWVREALMGNWPDFSKLHINFQKLFQRWQLNTHARPHRYNLIRLHDLIQSLEICHQSVIFQYDNKNTEMIETLTGLQENTSILFDLSHGSGVLPNEWPKPLDIPCGYAGGLSAENLKQQLEIISEIVGDKTIWIDAETHLRSSNDTVFSISKVIRFLETAAPWVI